MAAPAPAAAPARGEEAGAQHEQAGHRVDVAGLAGGEGAIVRLDDGRTLRMVRGQPPHVGLVQGPIRERGGNARIGHGRDDATVTGERRAGRGAGVVAWLRASHPGPTLAMTLAITGLCAAVGWPSSRLLACALAALAGQLSIGWANDAHDAELDRRAGRAGKPVVDGRLDERRLRVAALAALAACVPLSLIAGGWLAGSFHLIAVGSAWAYDLRLSRTPWSWLPYAVSFACLAPFATLGSVAGQWPPAWLPLVLALIGVAAHAANALPDLAADRAAGVGGMATSLGRRWAQAVALGCALAASILLAAAIGGRLGAVVILVSVLAIGAALVLRDDRMTFRLVMLAGLADLCCLMLSGLLLRWAW